ncbi:MAG: extracellular solute-binding protein [Firmicutes bacterium]|nr:extracellular solute-binding protein [Bacillota bacterium]
MSKKVVLGMFAVVLVLTLLFSLTACGEKKVPAPDEAKQTEPSQKEVVINFPSIWVGKDSKANVFGSFVKEFNEKNAGKIKVVVEEMADYQAYRDKMKTNIAAGTVPDVFSFNNAKDSVLYYKSGNLMDLTPHMNGGWKEDFIADALKEVTYQDKIMAMPYEFAVTPLMYNKRLLDKAGVAEFPKTMDAFIEMAEKLKGQGVMAASQMTGENGWFSMLWYSHLLVAHGGPDVFDRGLDDPAFLEAAKSLKKLFQYTTGDAVGAGAAVAGGHFLSEKTAILVNGPWFIGRIEKEAAEGMYEQVNVAPAPTVAGGKGKQGYYVGFIQSSLAAAKQKDKAKEDAVAAFFKYISTPENVKRLSLDSGSLFVIKFKTDENDKMSHIQKQMIEQSSSAPSITKHFNAAMDTAVVTEFPQALSGMILGEFTPEQFVEQLKQKAAQ